jgi:hypothetical protein
MAFARLIGSPLSLALLLAATGAQAHVVSEEDHHAFEHKYSEHCLKKEKEKLAEGATLDLKAIAASCDCIAQEESKRLTSQEVKKYLRENKLPISLVMKSTGASFNCAPKQFP